MSSLRPTKLLFSNPDDYKTFNDGQYLSIFVVIFLYGIILISLTIVYLVSNFSPIVSIPVYVLCFLLVGWAQYSIGNGMHEAVHKNLLNKKGDFWASITVAYPIGLTMRYRETHLGHHRHIGTNQDPDFDLYSTFPASKIGILKRVIWFISGIPAVLQFLNLQKNNSKISSKKHVELVTFALVQVSIFVLFFLVYESFIYYFLFWVLPIATIGKLLSSTRLLCEHGSPDRGWVVRSIDGRRWQTWLLGAFDFNYHAEHHLFMSVPYANLKRLHERNRDYVFSHPDYQPFNGRMEFFSGGYLSLLAKWFKELPWV